MAEGTPGPSSPKPASISFDSFTICTALGVILIAAGALLAFDELEEGGGYALWYALIDFVGTAAVGVLILVCARRLKPTPWGDGLLRLLPALGIAAVVASASLALEDATGEFADEFWAPLEDLVFYIPVVLGVLLYLSAAPRGDRVLGRPSQWARLAGAVSLVGALAIAIHDASDAPSDEFWVFLGTLSAPAGLSLLLIACALEPLSGPRPATPPNSLPMLNDARMPNWLALGGVGVIVAGVMLGFRALDAASDGFWFMAHLLAMHLGLGLAVLIAANVPLSPDLHPRHPGVRWAAIASIVAAFIAGVKFTADADSDQFWLFLDLALVPMAFGALAFAMYEATQRAPLRIVGGGK